MANLGILNGAEFYLYDVEVYDKILYGKINFKSSQVSSITSKGYKILSNGFYGINRTELIKQFIKYLAKMGINVDSDSFLLNEVTDKRIKKEGTYVNDPHIFSSSASQYDAQSTNKNTTNTNAKKEVKVAKPILDIDIINKDNMYKTTLNLKDYNLGDGTKTLYAFTQPQLKDKIESYFKSFKLDYDVNLNLVKPTQDVGKVLIDVTLNKDKVIGEVDLSHMNLPNIKAEATTKQGLLDAIINQLKSQNLTGKLNWGKIVDNTKKVENKGGKKNMATMTKAGVKALATKLSKAIKTIGMNQDEIEARVLAMVPNAISSDPTLAGNKVDLSFILPWDVSDSLTKTDINKIAKEKDTLAKYIDVLDAKPWLYITDEIGDGIRIEVSIDVNFENSFYDEQDSESFELVSIDIPIQVEENEDALPKDINTKNQGGSNMDEFKKVLLDNGLQIVLDNSNVTQGILKDEVSLTATIIKFPNKKIVVEIDKNCPFVNNDGIEMIKNDKFKYNDIGSTHNFIAKKFNLNTLNNFLKDISNAKNDIKQTKTSVQDVGITKQSLPTTTMDSLSVRDEFIKQVLHGMGCTLINLTEEEFKKDVKAFHQVKVNNIKFLQDVNLDFPNQKICIATITVKGIEDREIVNANMSEEHKINFNGKLGTIRMKVNKDDINSITDIVNLIKELRSADVAVKNNDGGNTINNNVLETLKGDFAKIFNITKEDSQQLVGKLDNIELSIAVLNVGLSVSIKGIPTFEFVKFVSAGYSEKNKVLTRLYADTATDKIKSIFKLCKEVNDSQAKSMDKTEAIMRIELLLKQNTMDATQQAMNIALANNISQQELMDIMSGKLTATKSKAPASSSPVVNDIEPTDNGIDPKRKTEINYKASAVKDPDHKAQLDRMKAYVKKIADVVDADNDFTLRFLEEPKEFTKYKLPTVGVGLFYYGNKSIAELEQSPLYKKVYRGRGLSILRKFFKTTDQNGEKCLLVLFVDAQYAKQTKAKLIKESFEQNTKISINGKQYTIKAIYEDKFAIETIVGAMYIDMDSELIDLTINEE